MTAFDSTFDERTYLSEAALAINWLITSNISACPPAWLTLVMYLPSTKIAGTPVAVDCFVTFTALRNLVSTAKELYAAVTYSSDLP